jgi:hypothetical protein
MVVKLSRSFILSLAVIALLGGCGKSSSPTSVTNLDTTPPPTPTSLQAVTDATGHSTLSWEPSSAADLAGYEVWQCVPGDDQYTLAYQLAGDNVSYVLPPVEQATIMEYHVRAFDLSGNRSAYSSGVTTQLRPWVVTGDPGSRPNGHLDP